MNCMERAQPWGVILFSLELHYREGERSHKQRHAKASLSSVTRLTREKSCVKHSPHCAGTTTNLVERNQDRWKSSECLSTSVRHLTTMHRVQVWRVTLLPFPSTEILSTQRPLAEVGPTCSTLRAHGPLSAFLQRMDVSVALGCHIQAVNKFMDIKSAVQQVPVHCVGWRGSTPLTEIPQLVTNGLQKRKKGGFKDFRRESFFWRWFFLGLGLIIVFLQRATRHDPGDGMRFGRRKHTTRIQ